MKIAFLASECEPFAKSGGLADVVGSLSKALGELGHEVVVVLPFYRSIRDGGFEVSSYFDSMCVKMGNGIEEWCSVKKARLSEFVDAFFIESNKYFDRDGFYCDRSNNDFGDNAYRFAFFCRAALQLLKDMDFHADIVHCHDWQTSAVCAFLKIWDWRGTPLSNAKSVLTIHNIGYQGIYGSGVLGYCGFPWNFYVSDIFEDFGRINLLKGGIFFADFVTTVSPKYAEETLNSDLGCGLNDFLRRKGESYVGILNGIDPTLWNPAKDTLLPANFSMRKLDGKALCKSELQKRFALDVNENIPIVGVVSRFATQKGLDVLANSIERIVTAMQVQFAVMGSGEPALERHFQYLRDEYPGVVGDYIGFNNEIAHLVEAGSDFFIMPSRYEPCGLNQIYSLRYGTLPIVRNTGGLADTVDQYDEKSGKGTGFKFDYLSEEAIFDTVGWAVSTYFDRPEQLLTMRRRAMRRDFSWKSSAAEYEKIYRQAAQGEN